MDNDQPKITSDVKVKNPLRVEQGKRLAAMSKAAKEKKMRERIMQETQSETQSDASDDASTIILLVPVVLVGLAAFGVWRYSKKNVDPPPPQVEKKDTNPFH